MHFPLLPRFKNLNASARKLTALACLVLAPWAQALTITHVFSSSTSGATDIGGVALGDVVSYPGFDAATYGPLQAVSINVAFETFVSIREVNGYEGSGLHIYMEGAAILVEIASTDTALTDGMINGALGELVILPNVGDENTFSAVITAALNIQTSDPSDLANFSSAGVHTLTIDQLAFGATVFGSTTANSTMTTTIVYTYGNNPGTGNSVPETGHSVLLLGAVSGLLACAQRKRVFSS